MRAVYPGSFDPITNGHLDIIQRASQLSEKLIIAVLHNADKKPFFSTEERMQMINAEIADMSNVESISFSGLVVELVEGLGVDAIIRGMRDIGDFSLEWGNALINRHLGEVETLFLMTDPRHAFISSSKIKDIARWGGDVSDLVPAGVAKALSRRE